jgi:ATP-dependent DNA helicase RecG
VKQETLLNLIRSGESERVEFKRTSSKKLDQEIAAFANADGGYLLIGVDDKGQVVGTDLKAAQDAISSQVQAIIPAPHLTMHRVILDEKDVLVVEVGKSDELSSIGGVVYIRIGTSVRPLSIQEILMLSAEMGTVAWDESPLISKDNAKDQYFEWYFKRLEESRGKSITYDNRDRYLRSARAVKGDKLTNAGVLFFSEVSDHLPFAKIRIITMDKGEPVASREYEGPVWSTIESAYTDLMRDLRKTEVIVGTRRVKIEEYPPRALREAIINAISHRNYIIQADTRIFVHWDHIEIRSPGGLLPGVNLDDPEHIPRNPALSHLLYDTGYTERYGYGIRLIRNEVARHSLCTVEFRPAAGRFAVIFSKKTPTELDENDKALLNLLQKSTKSSDLASAMDVSKPTVIRKLKRLEDLGLIIKEGSGPRIKYRISGQSSIPD